MANSCPMPYADAGLITPSDEGLQKNVQQIYPIVNAVFEQMTGQKGIQAVDTNSLVAMGQRVINSGQTEVWLNTLARRIGYTIDTFRAYRNKYSGMARTQLEWGAIVQKITVDMPEAVLDKAWDVGKMDGESVDQWIINNPKVHQRFFDNETAYAYFITIQTAYLNRAFLNAGAMAALITQIFGKVQNKREFAYEELARLCIANLCVNLKDFQKIHLVTMYNNATGAALTPNSAKYDAAFMRFALATINQISRKFESMSVLYNSDKEERFTPRESQRLFMLADFMTFLETIPEYLAYAHDTIGANPDMLVPYWQASGTTSTPDWEAVSSIKATNNEGSTVEQKNLIGILHDYEVMGTFRREEEVLTTPVNARARYYNTFWHEGQFWFNMSDENAVAFYLD